MTPETSEQVLHAIGEGVAKLRRDHANAASQATALGFDVANRDRQIDRLASQVKELQEKLDTCRRERLEWLNLAEEAQSAVDQEEASTRALLSKYDRITLDLYHLIVELSGHRDTGKTKAERIALGHVVERLKEIRGWSAADAS